jgi:hypothetical protein
MRGYFSGDRFVAERAFITADGIKGVELYQGVLSNNGNVITGTFTAVSEAGAVVSTDTFVATLSY